MRSLIFSSPFPLLARCAGDYFSVLHSSSAFMSSSRNPGDLPPRITFCCSLDATSYPSFSITSRYNPQCEGAPWKRPLSHTFSPSVPSIFPEISKIIQLSSQPPLTRGDHTSYDGGRSRPRSSPPLSAFHRSAKWTLFFFLFNSPQLTLRTRLWLRLSPPAPPP